MKEAVEVSFGGKYYNGRMKVVKDGISIGGPFRKYHLVFNEIEKLESNFDGAFKYFQICHRNPSVPKVIQFQSVNFDGWCRVFEENKIHIIDKYNLRHESATGVKAGRFFQKIILGIFGLFAIAVIGIWLVIIFNSK